MTNKNEKFSDAKPIDTGLPDFHKMVVSVFKTSLKKQKSKVKHTVLIMKTFDTSQFKKTFKPETTINRGLICFLHDDSVCG